MQSTTYNIVRLDDVHESLGHTELWPYAMDTRHLGLVLGFQVLAPSILVYAAYVLLLMLKNYAQLSRLPRLRINTNGETKRVAFLKSANQLYLDGYKQVGT